MGETNPLIAESVPEATYSLDELAARSLCEEFMNDPSFEKTDTRFGCYTFTAGDKYSNMGRFVESTVFYETFGNQPELMDAEYSEYDPASEFYVVVDHLEGLPVGVMRIIKNSPAGLKSLEDLKNLNLGFEKDDVVVGYGIDLDRCVDVATLAVLEQYRGAEMEFLPSKLTYRSLFLNVLNNPEFDHTVAIIDKKAEKNLALLKFPFSPIFESGYFSYLDSTESVALIAKNTMFVPQLTYWINRLRDEAQGDGANGMEQYIADTIDSLINSRELDKMLGKAKV